MLVVEAVNIIFTIANLPLKKPIKSFLTQRPPPKKLATLWPKLVSEMFFYDIIFFIK